jgi:F-type H+-transporting ATPase subunit b
MDITKMLGELNIRPELFLVNIIGFGILLFLANKLVFVPIGKVLSERESDVNGTYDRLDADQREMKALKEDYEARLAAIEAEAREKIQSAIKEAQAARDQIVAEANTRSREIITRAESEAAREREQAMIEMRQQIVELALGATQKLIGDGLDASRQKKLVDEFIAGGLNPAVGGAAEA